MTANFRTLVNDSKIRDEDQNIRDSRAYLR